MPYFSSFFKISSKKFLWIKQELRLREFDSVLVLGSSFWKVTLNGYILKAKSQMGFYPSPSVKFDHFVVRNYKLTESRVFNNPPNKYQHSKTQMNKILPSPYSEEENHPHRPYSEGLKPTIGNILWYLAIIVSGISYLWVDPRTNPWFLLISACCATLLFWACPNHWVSAMCRFIEGSALLTALICLFKNNPSSLFKTLAEMFLTILCRLVLAVTGISKQERKLRDLTEKLKDMTDPDYQITEGDHKKCFDKVNKIRRIFLVFNSLLFFFISFNVLTAKPWSEDNTLTSNLSELSNQVSTLQGDFLTFKGDVSTQFSTLKNEMKNEMKTLEVKMESQFKSLPKEITTSLKEEITTTLKEEITAALNKEITTTLRELLRKD